MTPHFSDAELVCHCGCGMLPKPDFMAKVENLRVIWGAPIHVISAARCTRYNQMVAESGPTGPHTTGRAIDLEVQGEDAFHFLQLVFAHSDTYTFTGIGIKQKGQARMFHLDDLPLGDDAEPRPRIWTY